MHLTNKASMKVAVTDSDGKTPFFINSLYALFPRDFYKIGVYPSLSVTPLLSEISKPNTGGGFL